jgi:histidinol-phosphate aminotransferase
VRQPYSVDAVSQAIALEVVERKEAFVPVIDRIKAQRAVLFEGINALPGATAYPSEANFLLVKIDDAIDAGAVWQRLFDTGVLVRDFSRGPLTRNCLRVSVGTPEENAVFLSAFADALKG